MDMRDVFANELDALMEKDERICIVDADLSKASGTIKLQGKYPERALDVGVAEANMACIAAGLSSYGFIPFITSFGVFASRRICDQVAVSIAYARQNVKIVGTDPGVSAALNGGTHMPFEDMGVLRSIPTMVIYEPVDEVQLRKAMPQLVEYKGPVYIRLFRKAQPRIFEEDYDFNLFRADIIREGRDVTILATGIMVQKALDAATILDSHGIRPEIINVHTIKPLDEETILSSVKKTGAVVTAENHNIIGGLYSAVSELLAAKYPVYMERVGIEDRFGEVGQYEELAEHFGLTAENIANKAMKLVSMEE
ncbi:MAG: transketolase family protein [Caldicoprobacterales bacterium]|jgi:transketolase